MTGLIRKTTPMNNSYKSRSYTPPPADPWDGVLLVDKPAEFTSHDVVAKVRGHFRLKKVGHGGTLDPAATGLLVLLTGRGTRLSGPVMGGDKTYEGIMRLGVTTDTQDADGTILDERSVDGITEEQVRAEMNRLIGDQMQTPPMVSAIKKNGIPLYKLARKGEVVEREPRFIHLYNFSLLSWNPPDVGFAVKCTKGTYVRTLCADIGEAIGCGAHLAALRRTASGSFHVNDALPLAALLELDFESLCRRILPMNVLADRTR